MLIILKELKKWDYLSNEVKRGIFAIDALKSDGTGSKRTNTALTNKGGRLIDFAFKM